MIITTILYIFSAILGLYLMFFSNIVALIVLGTLFVLLSLIGFIFF